MIHLLSILLALAPAKKQKKAPPPPAATCPCELHDWKCRAEHPVCKEQQPQATTPPAQAPAPIQKEEPAPIEEREPSYKHHSLRASGLYLLANPAGVDSSWASSGSGRPIPEYLWGLGIGGWLDLAKPLSFAFGLRFEHSPGADMVRAGVPLRVAVGSDFFSVYGAFIPGFTTVKTFCAPDAEGIYFDCDRGMGGSVGFAAGVIGLPWRGLVMSAEPGIERFFFKDAAGNAQMIQSFVFRVWFGWKFGKTTSN